MPDILFIKTSSLGDVIHHMPALTEARRHLPQAHFSWLVEEAFAPLVRLHPAVSDVIPVASRRWRRAFYLPSTWSEIGAGVAAIRSRRYDEIVDTQGLLRSAVMARLARGRRHGYDAQSIRERAASLFYDVRHSVSRDQHAIARNRALDWARARLHARRRDRLRARAAGTRRAGGRLLRRPAARHRAAGEGMAGGIVDRARAGAVRARCVARAAMGQCQPSTRAAIRIAAALTDARVPERQPLDAVARLIAGASFVIGVDTGLLHLAAALGVPLVGIFVGSEPGLTGPMGSGPIAIVGGKGETPPVADVMAALDSLA